MTLNKIAYRIIEDIRTELGADESIDIREIKHDILNLRTRMIRSEIEKNRGINSSLIQSIGCMKVIPVDASTCCVSIGECQLLRTEEQVPQTIDVRSRTLLTRVGPTNIVSSGYDIISIDRVPSAGSGRFNKSSIFVFVIDGYIYLMQRAGTVEYKGISVVNVMGVFDDPEALIAFKNCDGEPCYSDDVQLPIERWMLVSLEAAIVKKYIVNESATGEDKSLDNDNIIEGTKQGK